MSPGAEDPPITLILNSLGDWDLPEDLLQAGVLEALQSQEAEEGELSLTFLDDMRIQRLNRDHLGRDHPTDVIAFALHEAGEPFLGDVYVGYEQARRQAQELDIPLSEELLRLAVHGTLHVLGLDHPEGDERLESPMFRLQEELVERVLSASTSA